VKGAYKNMDRTEALTLIKQNVSNKNLIKHMLATEVCMKKLAEYFNEDIEIWSLTGLLHDIDYDKTKDDFDRHGLVSAEMLAEAGCPEKMIDAIKAHASKKQIENKLEQAIYSGDPLTGLIVAAALMHPEKKIKAIDTQFVINRFNEKRFAAGANRDQIRSCEKLGLDLEKFIGICLESMQNIDSELGL
jgi:putative nucleotidyltransferase with HDIG domain